jgi:hypothetical protein
MDFGDVPDIDPARAPAQGQAAASELGNEPVALPEAGVVRADHRSR